MTDYTQFAIKDLCLKWIEMIGRAMLPVRRSLIIKYLIWYEQAKWDKVSEQYVRRILELSFLSPKIVRAILTGKQPADCTLKHLLSIHTPNWCEQEEIFFR